jgi:hypothetical protein
MLYGSEDISSAGEHGVIAIPHFEMNVQANPTGGGGIRSVAA